MQTQCAILAGGKNSRYGGFNKAFILVDGERIIDRNLKVLEDLFSHISLVTNYPDQFLEYTQFPMSKDCFQGIGPLAGIHSALKYSKCDAVLVVSCDMPFLSKEIISQITNLAQSKKYQAIIPRWDGKIEPLFAMYQKSLLPKLEDYINAKTDRSVRNFLNSIDCKYLDLETGTEVERSFLNINSPSDLEVYNAENH